jgi:hypothetical protein
MDDQEKLELLRDLRSKLQCLDYSVTQQGNSIQVFRTGRAVSIKEIKRVAREEVPTYTKVLSFSQGIARYFYVVVSI